MVHIPKCISPNYTTYLSFKFVLLNYQKVCIWTRIWFTFQNVFSKLHNMFVQFSKFIYFFIRQFLFGKQYGPHWKIYFPKLPNFNFFCSFIRQFVFGQRFVSHCKCISPSYKAYLSKCIFMLYYQTVWIWKKMWFTLKNVFYRITKHVCPNFKMYKLRYYQTVWMWFTMQNVFLQITKKNSNCICFIIMQLGFGQKYVSQNSVDMFHRICVTKQFGFGERCVS